MLVNRRDGVEVGALLGEAVRVIVEVGVCVVVGVNVRVLMGVSVFIGVEVDRTAAVSEFSGEGVFVREGKPVLVGFIVPVFVGNF